MATLHDAIGAKATRVKQFILEQEAETDIDAIQVTFSRLPSETVDEVVDALRLLPFVVSSNTV